MNLKSIIQKKKTLAVRGMIGIGILAIGYAILVVNGHYLVAISIFLITWANNIDLRVVEDYKKLEEQLDNE